MEADRCLRLLVDVSKEIAEGRYKRALELFELTKEGLYPPRIAELAESFGMMLVKVEAREYQLEQIIAELKKAERELSLAKERLAKENLTLRHTLRTNFAKTNILGASPQIKDLLRTVERIAGMPVNVLITGETGTGKELFARMIHYRSGRSEHPFVALNCSAIPETLFESEMFGIEKGVATGVDKRTGKIEQANGGTLFLDEIGDMPAPSQGKMLRVIEERELDPVGSRRKVPVDVRIIAATNKDLEEEIGKGGFRKDLFYRLNVVTLHVPPLRERKDDVPLLVNFFLQQSISRLGRHPMRFSPEALQLLVRYPWPGNVRELENEVERAVALAYDEEIAPGDLSPAVTRFGAEHRASEEPLSVKGAERDLIEKALLEAGGNKTKAAVLLGISREGLRRKMNRYGL